MIYHKWRMNYAVETVKIVEISGLRPKMKAELSEFVKFSELLRSAFKPDEGLFNQDGRNCHGWGDGQKLECYEWQN